MVIEFLKGRSRLPWAFWLIPLLVWTLLLITPGHWFPGGGRDTVGGMSIGKLIHVFGYAALSGAAGWLNGSRSIRTAISFSLILHGGLTESLQLIVPFREGSLRDVGIDAISVIAGWLATLRWRPV